MMTGNVDIIGLTSQLAGFAAVASLALAGLAVVLRAQRTGLLLFVLGILLAVFAAFIPTLIRSASMLAPLNLVTALAALVGLALLASGYRKSGLALVWPAISKWLIWPAIAPVLRANWFLLVLIVAPFSLFILIWMLERVVRTVYGERVAGHVAGEYLVRTLDLIGGILGSILASPFRLLARRRH